jgi:hypothetical protein
MAESSHRIARILPFNYGEPQIGTNKSIFSKIMGVAGSRAGCEGIQSINPRLFLVLFIKRRVIIISLV